ncbi:MAG: magnesium/cobalt transporter CorA [Halobacteriaceae archaeon]
MSLDAVAFAGDGVTEYDDVAAAKSDPGTTWVHLTDPGEAELERVRETFGIHPLAVEDVRQGFGRPKTEEYDGYTFVYLLTARLAPRETTFREEVATQPVGLFVGADWLVSLSTGPVEALDRTRERVAAADPRLLGRGPDFTAYRVVDAVVDDYFDLLDAVEDEIERVEENVVEAADPDTLEDINSVRRDLLAFRKVAWPTREAVGALARGDPDQIDPENEKYFRDVYDHVVQVVDLIETYRDLTGGARDIYLNALSTSTNEVMKTLTVVATIILPLTFVVGVYGMNFGASPYNMPELGWRFGYPAVMAGMVGVAGVMVAYFRRRGWI